MYSIVYTKQSLNGSRDKQSSGVYTAIVLTVFILQTKVAYPKLQKCLHRAHKNGRHVSETPIEAHIVGQNY